MLWFNKPIKKFDGSKYSFLSNFYESPVTIGGITWTSTEAYYQAMKDPSRMQEFVTLSPYYAKKLGRKVKVTEDWEYRKIFVMKHALHVKFSDEKLKKKLLKTKNRELIEGNYWHDNFWGNCTCEKCKDIPGQNWLGKLLMKERDQIKQDENL